MPEPDRNGSRSVAVKDLYLADSWERLQEIAEDRMNVLGRQECKTVINSLNHSVTAADKSLSEGDEERAFILYHRATQLSLKYRKNPSVDLKYFDAMVKSVVCHSVKMCEVLAKSLQRRYEILLELKRRDWEAVSRKSSPASSETVTPARAGEKAEVTSRNHIISCIDLFNLVKSRGSSRASNPLLLVLDVRPRHEFQKSSISNQPFTRPAVVVLNIPEEAVVESSSMTALELRLESSIVQELRDRRKAHKIVLLDDSSSAIGDDTALSMLYSLLWDFSRSGEKSSEPPVVLQGGFSEWLITYPMHVTDSSYMKTQNKITEQEAWALDYGNDDEKVEKSEPSPSPPPPESGESRPMVNGSSHVSLDSNEEEEQVLKSWNKSHPGSAQPVGIPGRARPEVPDRSAKPNIPASGARSLPAAAANAPRDPDLGKAVGESPKRVRVDSDSGDLLDQLSQAAKTINLDLDQHKTPDASLPTRIKSPGDNNEAASAKSDVSTKTTNGFLPAPDREIGRTVRTTDRTLSESKDSSGWKSGGGPGGLSRSYSSPSIAKIVEQNENNLSEVPAFDRGKKPLPPKITYREQKQKKFREFNGIYGHTLPGLTGLRNLGMTCFMNAVIQCLSNTKEMNNYFVRMQKHESEVNRLSRFGSRGELTEELAEVLKALWSGQYKSIAPRDFKNAVGTHLPAFGGCEQQDAHEFFTMLLEKLHYDLNQAQESAPIQLSTDLQIHIGIQKFWQNHLQRNDSLVSKLFEGLLLSTLTCRFCLYQSHTYETFTCLSLPIPSEQRCTIQDCLREEFTKPEKLESSWDCDKCKVKRVADRRIQLCRLPPILVIHLKRFSFDGIWRKKLNTSVEFPLESLDMTDFMYVNEVNGGANRIYDLTGVVSHSGTLEGGHYTATCKNPLKGKWFKYDDTDVSDLAAADVRTQKNFSAGYVLFYSARERLRGVSVV